VETGSASSERGKGVIYIIGDDEVNKEKRLSWSLTRDQRLSEVEIRDRSRKRSQKKKNRRKKNN